MDNGASSYRRYLDGDDNGIAEIVAAYKDGLILYLNGYVENIHTAEELTEDTFFRLVAKNRGFPAAVPSKPGCIPLAGMWPWTICGAAAGSAKRP